MKKLRQIIPLTTYKAPSQNDRNAADAHPIDVVDPIDDNADGNDHVFRGSTTHSVTAVNDKAVNEEEALLEISKKILGSYIKKANKQSNDMSYLSSDLGASNPKRSRKLVRKTNQREKYIDKAVDKLTKEEVEQIDELSIKTLDNYVQKAQQKVGSLPAKKQGKRINSMGLASIKANLGTGHNPSLVRSKSNPKGFVPASKNVKEEQLDEISDTKKADYVGAASGYGRTSGNALHMQGNYDANARGMGKAHNQAGEKMAAKGLKRLGIAHKVKTALIKKHGLKE